MSPSFLPEPYLLEDDSGFFLSEEPSEPEFAAERETNATGQLGGTVFLHCPVVNSGDRAVSYPSVSCALLKACMLMAFLSFFSDDAFYGICPMKFGILKKELKKCLKHPWAALL